MWGTSLSGPLPIVALVGRYPANQLIGRMPIRELRIWLYGDAPKQPHPVLIPLSGGYPDPAGRLHTRYSPVRRSSAEQAPCYPSTCMC